MRDDFPVLKNYTYLNTASCGLLSKQLVKWRQEHDKKLLEGGSVYRDLHTAHIASIKKTVCNFFTVSENEVALVPNFSFGINTFVEALPKKQRVLLFATEYPSVSWAFENKGFEISYVPISENMEAAIEQAIAQYKPTIFAFSIVQYLTGVKLNFNFLDRIKAYHPDLLLVADGTQYLGTEAFNFSESPLDVLGASCYKWLLSGYGNGVFFVKEKIQPQLSPSTIGFNSADAAFSKRNEIACMRHFEPGHQDTLNYGSLEQSLLAMSAIGINKIAEKIKRISMLAKEAFSEKGLLDDFVVKSAEHSSIFNIRGNEALFQKLKNNAIITSLRGNGIRVSFHYYNNEDDLYKLLDLL